MSLDSINARLYGVTYEWGDINEAYNQFGAVGHTGCDVGAVYQPIYAEFPGTVIACAWGNGYGNHVKIKDIDGDVWVFAHLSEFHCSVGDEVMRGQEIGLSGETGFVTGPHCHIECFPVWGGDQDYYGTVDPIAYLAAETRDIEEYGVVPETPDPPVIESPPTTPVIEAPRPIEEAPALVVIPEAPTHPIVIHPTEVTPPADTTNKGEENMAATPTVKPGYKTTEFWLSLFATVLPATLPALTDLPTVERIVGLVLSVLVALGYTASRTIVKNADK